VLNALANICLVGRLRAEQGILRCKGSRWVKIGEEGPKNSLLPVIPFTTPRVGVPSNENGGGLGVRLRKWLGDANQAWVDCGTSEPKPPKNFRNAPMLSVAMATHSIITDRAAQLGIVRCLGPNPMSKTSQKARRLPV
jgi:hypothetical protein